MITVNYIKSSVDATWALCEAAKGTDLLSPFVDNPLGTKIDGHDYEVKRKFSWSEFDDIFTKIKSKFEQVEDDALMEESCQKALKSFQDELSKFSAFFAGVLRYAFDHNKNTFVQNWENTKAYYQGALNYRSSLCHMKWVDGYEQFRSGEVKNFRPTFENEIHPGSLDWSFGYVETELNEGNKFPSHRTRSKPSS